MVGFWILTPTQEIQKKNVVNFPSDHFKPSDHSKEINSLTDLLIRKFEEYKDGSLETPHVLISTGGGGACNCIRELYTVLGLSIFSNFIPVINFGIGIRHTNGHFLDYFKLKNPKLQEYFRFSRNADYTYMERIDENTRIQRNIDPKIQNRLKSSNFFKHSITGANNVFECHSSVCQFLANEEKYKSFVDILNGNGKKTIKGKEVKVEFSANWMYLSHIVRSKTKMDYICNVLNLCDGISQYLPYLDYDNFPEIGYQMIGYQLGGNIFNELFELHSSLQERFNNFIKTNIQGFFIALQLRRSKDWVDSKSEKGKGFSPPMYQIHECVLKMIEKHAENQDKITIYIASDMLVEDEMIRKIKNLHPKIVSVLSNRNYTKLDLVAHSEGYIYNINDHDEHPVSVVFDILLIKHADIALTQYLSSFGQVAASLSNNYPPYYSSNYDVFGVIPNCERLQVEYWPNSNYKWNDITTISDFQNHLKKNGYQSTS